MQGTHDLGKTGLEPGMNPVLRLLQLQIDHTLKKIKAPLLLLISHFNPFLNWTAVPLVPTQTRPV